MLTITFDDIRNAYAALADALTVALETAETAATVKAGLETARAAALSAGEIEGKNEAQREANLRLRLLGYYSDLEAAEKRSRRSRHEVELARLGVDAVRAQLRLVELAGPTAAE